MSLDDRADAEIASLAEKRLKMSELSEDALAVAFCISAPDLRYVAMWSKWYRWTSTVWIQDSTLSVYDQIRDFIKAVADEPKWRKAIVIAAIDAWPSRTGNMRRRLTNGTNAIGC